MTVRSRRWPKLQGSFEVLNGTDVVYAGGHNMNPGYSVEVFEDFCGNETILFVTVCSGPKSTLHSLCGCKRFNVHISTYL